MIDEERIIIRQQVCINDSLHSLEPELTTWRPAEFRVLRIIISRFVKSEGLAFTDFVLCGVSMVMIMMIPYWLEDSGLLTRRLNRSGMQGKLQRRCTIK